MGTCSGTGQNFMACATVADCAKNTCVIGLGGVQGTCSLNFATCSDTIPCAPTTAACSSRACNCINPLYNPADPICADMECEDICLYVATADSP